MSPFRLCVSVSASLVILSLIACGSDDPGSSSGSAADGGGSSSSSSSTSSSSSSTSSSSSSSSGDGGNPQTCQNFGFGKSAITGDALFDKCDVFPPRNCKTGSYIWFDDSKKADTCFCRVDCDDFNPVVKVGQACGGQADVICTSVKNKGGSSQGDTCLPKGWQSLNLCK